MGQANIQPEFPFPWGRFLLLWFLALVMGGSLIWLHAGFGKAWAVGMGILFLAMPILLAWAMTRPRWQKVTCSWCGSWGKLIEVRGSGRPPNWAASS